MTLMIIDPRTSGLSLGQIFNTVAILDQALPDGTEVGIQDNTVPSTFDSNADTSGRSILSKVNGELKSVSYPKGPSPMDIAWVRQRHREVAREAHDLIKDLRKNL